MCIRDLSIEFEKLDSAESVDSAQTLTTTSHEDWLGIKSVDVRVQKGLSNLLSSTAQREKLEDKQTRKSIEAFERYYKEGEHEQGNVTTRST